MKYSIVKHRRGWALYFGETRLSIHKTMKEAEIALDRHWRHNSV